MPYCDLRDYLRTLEAHGKLHRIAREVEREWEISAVCRGVFQDIPERQRPGLLFERIKGFDSPLAAGILGASLDVYSLALETPVERISERWTEAVAHPIAPLLVNSGPCKENILLGVKADITHFPWATWTVGHDAGPYITSGFVVTKDLRSGERNVGTYRQQIKGPRKTGMLIGAVHDGYRHIRNNEAIGEATPIAIVVGADPAVGLCSVSNLPPGADELAVAGGLRCQPVEVVKCETVDLEVPATAELVIEGEVPAGVREEEGPFGEYTGYMSPAGQHFVVNVTAITFRHRPILQAFISEMPPSESSTIRGLAHEQALRQFLRAHGYPVVDVHCLPAGGTDAYIAVSIDKKKAIPGMVRSVMFAVWTLEPRQGKITVVVDDDIDIRDPFQLNWALSFRTQPAQDMFIVPDVPAVANDPSTAPSDVQHHRSERHIGSKIGIDATRSFEFPPVALPPQEHLQRVREHWSEYGF